MKSRAVCILGMHRSGTSTVSGIINHLGAYLGEEADMMKASADNPMGYWERLDLWDIHDRLLASLGQRWDTTIPLPENWHLSAAAAPFRQELIALIRDKFSVRELWAWKDPRCNLLMPIWRDVLDELGIELKCVFIIRNPLDIAKSLMKRDGFSLHKGYGLWLNYQLAALRDIVGIPTTFVFYDRLFSAQETEARRLSDALGIEWPQDDASLKERLGTFIQPGLRHSHSSVEDLHKSNVPRAIADIYGRLIALSQGGEPLDSLLKGIEKYSEEFISYARLFEQDVAQSFYLSRQLAQKDAELAQKNADIAQKDAELAQKNADIAQKSAEITRINNALADIHCSTGYKILMRLYRGRDILFPKMSLRGKLFSLLIGLARISMQAVRSIMRATLNAVRPSAGGAASSTVSANNSAAAHAGTINHQHSRSRQYAGIDQPDKLIAIQAGLFEKTRMRLIRDIRKGAAKAAVFMPCGSGSIHKQWLDGHDRSWDLIVYCYDDTFVESIPADMVYLKDGGFNGSKFSAFARLIADRPDLVEAYDFWMLMDDDILTTVEDIAKFFRIMEDKKLDLAQPSLSHDSHCAWPILKHKDGARLRHVNAVEIMSFAFSRRALQAGKHLFRMSISGYGIDLAFGEITRNELGTMPAVVDAVSIKHTKVIDQNGGAFYVMLRSASISPMEELGHMQRMYNFATQFYELP